MAARVSTSSPGSPVAFAGALALTIANLLTGAWHSDGHGHEQAAESAAYCTVDHEAEATTASSRVTLEGAASLHGHSCVACKLGRSEAQAAHRKYVARNLRPVSERPGSDHERSPRAGDSWQHTARGPPRS